MGQCTIRWSNGHCAWSILPVGEANGNLLVRQAVQRLLSVGWWLSGEWPVWPNGHRGGCRVPGRPLYPVPGAGSRVGRPAPGQGPGPSLSDRQ